MRLTNTIRDAFVRAAMQDVPSVDYDELIRKAAVAAAVKALPPAVRKVYDDEKTRPYLETTYVRCGTTGTNVPGTHTRWTSDDSTLPALAAQAKEQESTHSELRQKLRGAAYAVSTRAALVEMLPEFEKYLPADEAAANRALPVIANIVADFTKAGWPKGKKPTKTKQAA